MKKSHTTKTTKMVIVRQFLALFIFLSYE